MKNYLKRQALFYKLKSMCYGMIYLQETYTALQEESLYMRKWSSLSFWNSHTSNGSRTAVLFGETFRPHVKGVLKGTQGQSIIIDIESDENFKLILANI